MNSFLALRDQDIVDYQQRADRIRERVERQLQTAAYIGDVLELFLPVMADTLTVMGGGDPILDDPDLKTISSAEDDDDPFGNFDDYTPPPAGPTGTGDLIR